MVRCGIGRWCWSIDKARHGHHVTPKVRYCDPPLGPLLTDNRHTYSNILKRLVFHRNHFYLAGIARHIFEHGRALSARPAYNPRASGPAMPLRTTCARRCQAAPPQARTTTRTATKTTGMTRLSFPALGVRRRCYGRLARWCASRPPGGPRRGGHYRVIFHFVTCCRSRVPSFWCTPR